MPIRAGITTPLPRFLAFLPEKMSPNKEKEQLNATANEKMMTNDVTTGFAAEMFAVILHPRSEAATGTMAGAKKYLTNDKYYSLYITGILITTLGGSCIVFDNTHNNQK